MSLTFGGGDGIGTLGGRRLHDIPHLPQFRFRLGFRPLYFAKRHAGFFSKNVEKIKRNYQILEGIIPLAFRIGGTRPPRPPS